jgi:hypothetical protein
LGLDDLIWRHVTLLCRAILWFGPRRSHSSVRTRRWWAVASEVMFRASSTSYVASVVAIDWRTMRRLSRRNRKVETPYDKALYRQRHHIENMLGHLRTDAASPPATTAAPHLLPSYRLVAPDPSTSRSAHSPAACVLPALARFLALRIEADSPPPPPQALLHRAAPDPADTAKRRHP